MYKFVNTGEEVYLRVGPPAAATPPAAAAKSIMIEPSPVMLEAITKASQGDPCPFRYDEKNADGKVIEDFSGPGG